MKTSKISLFVALGAAFWLAAALIIRFCGTTVFTENNPKLILLYLLAIPITFVFLWVTKAISNLSYADLLRPVVIITLTATFLDSIALALFRQLYSQSFEVALHGAALILWGVGLGLLLAFYLDSRRPKAQEQIDKAAGTLQ
jgi:predicted membrane chloride channel (bestrophin family)